MGSTQLFQAYSETLDSPKKSLVENKRSSLFCRSEKKFCSVDPGKGSAFVDFFPNSFRFKMKTNQLREVVSNQ